ncbi:hypothetical protein [Pyrobaculum neutrophilum]|nr:hypothetical protein [Pyrobaculum neutrophilum]
MWRVVGPRGTRPSLPQRPRALRLSGVGVAEAELYERLTHSAMQSL